MRKILALAAACSLGGSACARLNPEYGSAQDATGGAQTAGGSTRGVTQTAGGDSTGGASSAVSDSAVEGSESGSGPHGCGNGELEPGEACDDGNLEWGDGCDEVCRREPVLDWVSDSNFKDGIAERFNAVALVGDVVVAAGRGEDGASGDQHIRLVSLDPEDGDELAQTAVDADAGFGGEARGVAARGNAVYYAGRTNEPDVSAALGMIEVDGRGSFGSLVVLQAQGTRSKGIAFREAVTVVTNGQYNDGGLGLTTCDPAGGCEGWLLEEPGSQLDAVVVSDQDIFAAGLRGGSPHIFEVTDPTIADGLETLFQERRPGRFQALAVRGDILYAAGSVITDGDEDAWVVAYSLSMDSLVWEDQVDEGSMLDDEFEDLAVTDDGSLVVVGMLGTPPVPVVFEYGALGALRWGLWIEGGPDVASGHARGVAVKGEEIYVAGEWRQSYSPGDGASGTGVGFVAKILR